jgi:hypothetical protein
MLFMIYDYDYSLRCRTRSRSARISITLADPDPIPFQTNIKLNFTFSRNSQYAVQNIENYDTSDADEKDKTMLTGIAMNKSHNSSDFPKCSKLEM